MAASAVARLRLPPRRPFSTRPGRAVRTARRVSAATRLPSPPGQPGGERTVPPRDYDPQGGHHEPPEPEPDPSDEEEVEDEAGAGFNAAVRARLTQTGAIARRYSADA